MRTRDSQQWSHRVRLIAAAAVLFAAAQPGIAGLIPGGGRAASDCYVEFDVQGASGRNRVTCTDGDPACDTDGQCQGTCTFGVAICFNQSNVPRCTPKPLRRVRGGGGIPLLTIQGVSRCGPVTPLEVDLEGGERMNKRGRKKIKVTAIVTGRPSRETDQLTLTCQPRAGACPTTTTTSSTTSTTAPTTSTTTTVGTTSTTTTTPPLPDAAALFTGNRIAAFSTLDPAGIEAPVTLSGVNVGDVLVSIDRRPQNGFLYGLGYNAPAGTVQLYAVHPATGFATPIGTPGSFVAADGATPAPIIAGAFGIDFNPTVDRIRVVDDAGQNFRINPNTGAFIDGTAAVPGVQMDGAINGATSVVQETAYTNNALDAAVTTQYTLDQVTDALYIQNPSNNGTQTVPTPLSSAVESVLGFDIPPGVNVTTSSSVASGLGFAILKLAGQPAEVFTGIDLATGALSGTAAIGSGGIIGVAVQRQPSVPMSALSADGTQLLRFYSATPGTTVTVAITGIVAGEVLVGIDYRPQTGQLHALAVDATADTGTLYVLDPQTGAATAVGTAGQIAFVDAGGTPVDLPSAAAGYGVDFNPTVDRLRVVTPTGLNFRVNPNNGAPVDGDAGTPGFQPDSAINGATGSVDGAAYTNNTGGPLTAGVTTLYTIDAASNALFIQNPANAGTQTLPVPIQSNGAALDFSAANGFDIESAVRAPASGGPVGQGSAFAALTVGGSTRLYSIDLVTGAATDRGVIGLGGNLAGLAVGQTAVR